MKRLTAPAPPPTVADSSTLPTTSGEADTATGEIRDIVAKPARTAGTATRCSAAGETLVGGLGADAEGLPHLSPGPALFERVGDRGSFKTVSELAQRHDGRQRGSRIVRRRDLDDITHAINLR